MTALTDAINALREAQRQYDERQITAAELEAAEEEVRRLREPMLKAAVESES